MVATIVVYVVACLFAFMLGKWADHGTPSWRRMKRWEAAGRPEVMSVEETAEFRCWQALGGPVTGEGKGLYGAIMDDRKEREATIAEQETHIARLRDQLDRANKTAFEQCMGDLGHSIDPLRLTFKDLRQPMVW